MFFHRIITTLIPWSLVLGLLCSRIAQAQQNVPLRVMTYNLRYASDTPPNSWPERLPVAVAMLRDLQPDVMGTQEAL